jgi:hypothetical protein
MTPTPENRSPVIEFTDEARAGGSRFPGDPG